MTPLFPSQRAAEEFDQVLGGTAPPAVSDRYAELVEAVEVLRAQPEVVPRAEFVDDLRTRLMAAAETELVAAPSVVRHLQPTRTDRRRRRVGTIAASLVIVGGSAGMAAAASGSLPGEPLYPVKRGIEEVSAAVRLGEANHGEALLDQAATRLDEVRELQAQSPPDAELVADTLTSFQNAADEGSKRLFTAYQAEGDSEHIETVRSFTAEQMAQVAALAKTADEQSEEGLLDAADTLADIDQQARSLCGSCGGDDPVLPPAQLSAGAAAATLDNLLARPVAQARADIAAAEAARLAHLEQLQSAAEKSALTIPQDPGGATAPSIPSSEGGSVSVLLPRDGKLAPSLSDGTTTVKNLVSGVTGSLDGTLDQVTSKVTEPTTPLDSTVEDLDDTVDDATGNLTP